MVFTIHLVDNDLAGQNPEAFLVKAEGDVKIRKIIPVKRILATPQHLCAPVLFIPLEKGFPQSLLNRTGGQLLLFADVLDQGRQARKHYKRHGWSGCG